MSYLLVSGCSHTVGTGLSPQQAWPYYLVRSLMVDCVNLAKPGANSAYVCRSLDDYLSIAEHRPVTIIAQWPNPFRSMRMTNTGEMRFVNIHNMDQQFAEDFKNNPDKFWQQWMQDIIQLNRTVPVINICLESQDFIGHYCDILKEQHNIILHIDQKVPDKTWYFDNLADDGMHHSVACHRKWADRILTLLPGML